MSARATTAAVVTAAAYFGANFGFDLGQETVEGVYQAHYFLGHNTKVFGVMFPMAFSLSLGVGTGVLSGVGSGLLTYPFLHRIDTSSLALQCPRGSAIRGCKVMLPLLCAVDLLYYNINGLLLGIPASSLTWYRRKTQFAYPLRKSSIHGW